MDSALTSSLCPTKQTKPAHARPHCVGHTLSLAAARFVRRVRPFQQQTNETAVSMAGTKAFLVLLVAVLWAAVPTTCIEFNQKAAWKLGSFTNSQVRMNFCKS